MFLSPNKITPNRSAEEPRDWAEFWEQLFNLTYNLKAKFPRNPKDNLCASTHFLATQISSIDWYDPKGNKHSIFDFTAPPPNQKPTRLVAKINHLEVEYHAKTENSAEYIQASGFAYDVNSNDLSEADNAMMEKAAAALSMVYMAKANGWTSVNFDQTSDPIDRAMLIMACDKLGISYGEEKIWESANSNVAISDIEEFFGSTYFKAYDYDINDKKKLGYDEDQVFITIVTASFENYANTPSFKSNALINAPSPSRKHPVVGATPPPTDTLDLA